jgi:hypothetical protein
MTTASNPYVGPRTFTEPDGKYYFGREQEARDLTARIVSERLLLFYAQSGAGKSSLINTRVIPRLRDEEGFIVLPVGRVSGELPPGVGGVENIYAFNLMNSLDQSSGDPGRLAGVRLTDFLARLARETAVDEEGKRVTRWVYKPDLEIDRGGAAGYVPGPRFALVIDQFEEIITSNPDHWQEREDFFRQLNQALVDDPNLWVVLTLREDYIAALDPYAPLVLNRMRARFYMERMDEEDALEAVREPAELAGRPFAPGVAEELVDDLRQVRVPGRDETVPSQYVEPVQLQVVCYQMWQNLEVRGGGAQITSADLEESGDVDQALSAFYEETLHAVLADPDSAGVDERQLRRWFDRQLITAAGTRGLVHQGQKTTGGLPNEVVGLLQARFLVRSELRAGATWVELVHDRFVKPIHDSNSAWFEENLSLLQRQALLWDREERPPDLLLRGKALQAAEDWSNSRQASLQDYEKEYLAASQLADKAATKRERQRTRLIATLAVLAVVVAGIALALLAYAQSTNAERSALEAQQSKLEAQNAQAAATSAQLSAEAAQAQAQAAQAEALAVEESAREQATMAALELADRATRAAVAVEAAVIAQNQQQTAVAAKAQAEAASTVAAAALETSVANLQIALTGQASAPGEASANTENVTAAEDVLIEADVLDFTEVGPFTIYSLPLPPLPFTGPGDEEDEPGIGTPQADATQTPTAAFTPTAAATATMTPTPNSAQVLAAQLVYIQATQTRLAGGAAEPEATPEAEVVANWIPMTVLTEPDEGAARVAIVRPWEKARIRDTERDRWLLVETEDGVEGWVDGRWRVYVGDAAALPGALSYRLISDRGDLAFVFGEVVDTGGGNSQYQMRFEPSLDAEAIIGVPVGTEVIVLQDGHGQNGDWLLVTLADIGGDRLIRTGYLPQNIVEEAEPFFNLEDQPVSETGVVACALETGDVVRVTSNARLWSDPDVSSGDFLALLGSGQELIVIGSEPVWGPIRQDTDDSGWWWQVQAEDKTEGWIWQDRLVECRP